ncbi:FIMAH domain-containing protein [Rubrivirga sp. IMCC45206]|uniref:FIMAH domain-containing protein n=1 Tax=Rubrivirga sp. IMCC45206 TaxID=3391614 RepID=UPI00398FA73A
MRLTLPLALGLVLVLAACDQAAGPDVSVADADGTIAFARPAPPSPVASYDFNGLTGNDTHPYVTIGGQDNWTTEGFPFSSFYVGVSETFGFDGTPAPRFSRAGPGYGADASRVSDGAFSIPSFDGSETHALLEVEMGGTCWGTQFALGHDSGGDGAVRRYTPLEVGPQIVVRGGCIPLVSVIEAGGTGSVDVPRSAVGPGTWVRMRLVMDLAANGGAGTADAYYRNLSDGDPAFQPVPALQGVPLGLVPGTGDGRDPSAWDAMWFHFEGANSTLDNIRAAPDARVADAYDIMAAVEALGSLNQGQKNALTSKLRNVIAKLERGKERPAMNQLGAFVNQVEAFVRSGRLTAAEGDPLLAAAEAIASL